MLGLTAQALEAVREAAAEGRLVLVYPGRRLYSGVNLWLPAFITEQLERRGYIETQLLGLEWHVTWVALEEAERLE